MARTTYFDLGDKENIAGKEVMAQNISDSYLESTEPLSVEAGLDVGGADLSVMSVGVYVFL